MLKTTFTWPTKLRSGLRPSLAEKVADLLYVDLASPQERRHVLSVGDGRKLRPTQHRTPCPCSTMATRTWQVWSEKPKAEDRQTLKSDNNLRDSREFQAACDLPTHTEHNQSEPARNSEDSRLRELERERSSHPVSEHQLIRPQQTCPATVRYGPIAVTHAAKTVPVVAGCFSASPGVRNKDLSEASTSKGWAPAKAPTNSCARAAAGVRGWLANLGKAKRRRERTTKARMEVSGATRRRLRVASCSPW